jgi:hypothetical protein
MIRLVLIGIVVTAAGCGFQCTVNGQTEHFNDCNALQQSFSTEQAKTDPPPDEKTLNDLNTCGSINGCNIKN